MDVGSVAWAFWAVPRNPDVERMAGVKRGF